MRWITKWMTNFLMRTTSKVWGRSYGARWLYERKCGVCHYVCFLQAGLPRSVKLPVLNLLTGQKSGSSPRRCNSLHRFTSNFAGPTGISVRLALQHFTSIAIWGVGIRPQKYQKFPLFGKYSPRRGDSLDRFQKVLVAFIRLTILH